MDYRLLTVFFIYVFLCEIRAQNVTETSKNDTKTEDSDIDTDSETKDCWSNFSTSCLQDMSVKIVEDLLTQDEVHLTNFVVIEKVDNDNDTSSNETETGRADTGGAWIDKTKLEQLMTNVGRFLSSRALKINVLNAITVRVARSKEYPDNIEISLGKIGEEEGKANRMTKIIVPLIVGFKTAGAIAISITAVKLVIFKALAVSKLALLVAGIILLRKILMAMGVQHHTFLYNTQSIPHHHDHQQHHHPSFKYNYDGGGVGHGGAPSAYAYNSPYYGHSAMAASETAAQYDGQYDSQYLGHYPVSGAGLTSPGGDLQGHYSHQSLALVGAEKNKTSASARSDDESKKPPVYNLVNSNAHRVPIFTYKKLVTTGRKM